MRLRLLSVTTLMFALAGPAAAQEAGDPGPANQSGGSSYGQFLAGRIAMNRGDSDAATAFFSQALAGSQGQLTPRERAFSAAILAGDIRAAAAVRLTAEESSPAVVEAGRLAGLVQAILDGDSRALHRDIQARPIGAPHAWAGGLATRWLAADAGDWRAALAPPPDDADAVTRIFGGFHRALLLERARRYDEADTQFRRLLMDGTAAPIIRLPYGAFLERRGRRDEAVAVYDGGLALGADPALAAARGRAVTRGRPPAAPTIREGAALAFSHAAAATAVAQAHEFTVAYLRMALALDPSDGEAWLTLGHALTEIGMPATAREAWASTPIASRAYVEARINLAASLDEAGETEAALRVARDVADARPEPASAVTLAALLAEHEQYEEALAVLDGPELRAVEDWNLHFLRGAAHERLGRYAEAEAAFQQALLLSPTQPEILNYLGYLWIDRGVRVEEGLGLVERALAVDPDNGSYQDSLGWGRYRQGRYEEAVALLEQAVGLSPASPVINDHLGDAYWRVGRVREARYQWERVLTLDPDSATRAAAEAKLAGAEPS